MTVAKPLQLFKTMNKRILL